MTWQQVHAFSQGLDLIVPPEDPVPSYNVAPTQHSPVLVADLAGARAMSMRWGLVPPWCKDLRMGASMINARLETVAVKPAFRSAWKARRCLVPASGYYEWRLEEGVKQPYWIHDRDSPILMFAGLWENWQTSEGDGLQSFAIITCPALDSMQQLHDRTPVMLAAPQLHAWLHGDSETAASIADQAQPPALAWHAVSRAVSNPRNDSPRLIDPLPPAPSL